MTKKHPSTRGRTVPDIQRSYGKGWYSGEAYLQSTHYNGSREMSKVSYPIFNSYATLRFQQTYTMALESIGRDNRKNWSVNNTTTNKTLADAIYWGTELEHQRARVFCEIQVSRSRMIGALPCFGRDEFEPVYGMTVCLHMKMDAVFTYPEAEAYCEKLNSYIWLPQDINEERHIFDLFVNRVKFFVSIKNG